MSVPRFTKGGFIMKTSILIVVCLLIFTFSIGCRRTPGPAASPAPTQGAPGATNPAGATPDAVSSPSVVADEASLVKAMGTEGTWIIIFTSDFSTNKELVLEGEYTNGKKDDAGKDVIQRKIALYTQDDKRNITNRFTLTAPKLTVTSPMASIQHGTFKGDLVVSVDNFQLADATVDGNVYFATDSAKTTFKMDEASKITGKQEIRKP
jgi:hypothetical protein